MTTDSDRHQQAVHTAELTSAAAAFQDGRGPLLTRAVAASIAADDPFRGSHPLRENRPTR